jgi:hypothetical protein
MIHKRILAHAAAIVGTAILATVVMAQDAAQDTTGDASQPKADGGISLELNKLETSDKGCRAYVVVTNPSDTTYDAYKLDLVMFQPDGIIGRRFAVDLAPLRASKRTVKLFELDGTQCDGIGSFLINDVMECRASSGPVGDCLAHMKVKSLTKVEISK